MVIELKFLTFTQKISIQSKNQSITETESLLKGLNHCLNNVMRIKRIHYQMR